MAFVPVFERFVGPAARVHITHAARHIDPRRNEVESRLDDLGRLGQRRVDRRSMRVNEVRPARIPEPERAAAFGAEATLGLRAACALARLANQGVVGAEVARAADLQRGGVGAQVDRVPAAAGVLRRSCNGNA
jgi:hypothetical protein